MKDGQILGIFRAIIPLAGIVLASVGALFAIGYGGIYKKVMHGKRCVTVGQIIHLSIMVIYLTGIYGVAFMERVSGLDGGICLEPFFAYKVAWRSYGEHPWRDIILNIIMFIPWGVLVPLCIPRCRKFGNTLFFGILGTLTVETLQYVTQRGIFEFDDLFNNTLGTVIGYGIFMVLWWGHQYRKKEQQVVKKRYLVGVQIPLVLAILFFVFVILRDEQHKFGTLDITYQHRMNMDGIEVSRDIELAWQEEKVDVYVEDKDGESVDGGKTLKSVRKCIILTEKEAYGMIEKGYFYDSGYDKLESIRVIGLQKNMLEDSKGYYQPIYEFQVVLNEEEESVIKIPALR